MDVTVNTIPSNVTGPQNLRRILKDNIRRVRDRIGNACARVQRDPRSVQLVAVTKNVGTDLIRALLELGETELAENRVQELVRRASMIWDSANRIHRLDLGGVPPLPRWHMVGHVQRNKLASLLEWCNIIHSVDSLRLAEAIQHRASALKRNVEVLLQVNVADEKAKFGIPVAAIDVMVDQVRHLPNLQLVGLMTMAPYSEDPKNSRFVFARLRGLSDDLHERQKVGPEFRELSMGMSSDFEVAVEEGATLVRIGTALFEGLTTLPADESDSSRPEQ